jgi:hypothetical protein
MILIGCDFHIRIQQIAMLDPSTSEISERCLDHDNDDVERLYAALPGPARVGIEATIPDEPVSANLDASSAEQDLRQLLGIVTSWWATGLR